MKLIKEVTEEIKYISELNEETGKKSHFIEGVFLQSNLKNRNGRMYPKEVMQKEVARYTAESIDKKRAYGELGHPDGPTVNLDRVSHMIVGLKEDNDNYIGRAKILDTPMGRIVKELIDEGASLGVSSRGLGSLKERNGVNEVQEDFMLATAADIVADPSAPDAYVQGIMENKEWTYVNGIFQEKELEESKTKIRAASTKELEAVKLEVFENFLSKLSKI
tara:strand:- start:125 stop:784 length:660 start_codon:yes stop_codon:yes gene_type:complete